MTMSQDHLDERATALGGVAIEDCQRLRRLCASSRLRTLSRQITRHYERYLQDAGVTAAQMPILTFLYTSGSSTIPEIAEQLDLDRSTLSRNLNVLSRRNLLTLSGGRRRLPASVELTPIGSLRELLAALDTVERFAEKLQ
jgi:DNA-binding MarR family transcriptional regulator